MKEIEQYTTFAIALSLALDNISTADSTDFNAIWSHACEFRNRYSFTDTPPNDDHLFNLLVDCHKPFRQIVKQRTNRVHTIKEELAAARIAIGHAQMAYDSVIQDLEKAEEAYGSLCEGSMVPAYESMREHLGEVGFVSIKVNKVMTDLNRIKAFAIQSRSKLVTI